MPIIRHDSPYYTPLSMPARYVVTGIAYLVYRILRWFNRLVCPHFQTFRARHFFLHAIRHFQYMEESCRKSLAQGMQKTAEETALNSPSEIDTRAFMWTFDCLDEDHELERFFSGLPGFRSSKVVKDPLPNLTEEEKSKLSDGLLGLLDRTLSSDLLPAPVKYRRAMICAKAIDPEHTPIFILHAILFKYQHSGLVTTTIANILRNCENNTSQGRLFYTQIEISRIITRRQVFDDSWYTLASNILGFPETSLRNYAAHGDSLSLVILIGLVRLQFTHFRKSYWPEYAFSSVLEEASNFDAKVTSPELQHKFCTLWNQIVKEAQGNDRRMADLILRKIRSVYLSLHQDTDSAPIRFSASTDDLDDILCSLFSYPLCKAQDHRYDSTPHIHEDDISMTLTRIIPHDPNIPFLNSPDPPSSSTHAPFPADETLTNTLPLDNQISAPVSTQVIGQTTTEGHHVPTISPVPATTCAMHGSIDPSRTAQPSTSSPSPKSNASASPLAGITVGRTERGGTPLGDLKVLSSPLPVLDGILPAGFLLFSGRDLI